MTRFLLVAAILGISACSPELTHEARCNELVAGDAEAAEEFSRDGVSAEVFCSCYDSQLNKQDELTQQKHAAVFEAIIDLRHKNSIGVEPAAEVLEEQLRGPSNPHDFSERDFESVGKFLNETQNLLENGGTCTPA